MATRSILACLFGHNPAVGLENLMGTVPHEVVNGFQSLFAGSAERKRDAGIKPRLTCVGNRASNSIPIVERARGFKLCRDRGGLALSQWRGWRARRGDKGASSLLRWGCKGREKKDNE